MTAKKKAFISLTERSRNNDQGHHDLERKTNFDSITQVLLYAKQSNFI